MGLRFKEQIYGSCFFVTTSFYEHRRYGDMNGVYETLTDSLIHYLDRYNALLPGYVFMPSHLHLLIMIDGTRLAAFMRDFKKYLAQQSLPRCGIVDSHVWISGYDRQAVVSEHVFRTKLEYIHRNPQRAGLVQSLDGWKWSSASAYTKNNRTPVPVWTDWHF